MLNGRLDSGTWTYVLFQESLVVLLDGILLLLMFVSRGKRFREEVTIAKGALLKCFGASVLGNAVSFIVGYLLFALFLAQGVLFHPAGAGW